MSLNVLIALAAAVPVLPPAPSMSQSATPPIVGTRVNAERSIGPRVTFDVDVRLGDELLWSGTMRVSEGIPAQFTRNTIDAPERQCPGDETIQFTSRETTLLNVSLTRISRTADDSYQISASLIRPGTNNGCPADRGTRSVGITQNFALVANQTLTLHGDGGLAVRLRRR